MAAHILTWIFTLLIPTMIIGAVIIYPTFPEYLRKGNILAGLVFCFTGGLLAFVIASLTFPVTLIFPIYLISSLLHIFGPRRWSRLKIWRDTFKVATLALGVVWFFVAAIESFIAFQTRSREDEAKTNLASIATAEIYYYGETNHYSNRFEDIEWEPVGTTHYSIYFSSDYQPGTFFKAAQRKNAPPRTPSWEYSPRYPAYIRYRDYVVVDTESEVLSKLASQYPIGISADNFIAVAIGNIDDDPDWDVWLVDKTKWPKHIQSDRGLKRGNVILNRWVIEIYNDGFTIFPDRLTAILLVLNLSFWLIFSWLVRNDERRKATKFA